VPATPQHKETTLRQQSEFDDKGNITFYPVPPPPFDMKRFQKSMFNDRPDLWNIKRKPARRPVKPLYGQIVLFDERPPCTGGKCRKKGESKC